MPGVGAAIMRKPEEKQPLNIKVPEAKQREGV
jgi:hypothetical protein